MSKAGVLTCSAGPVLVIDSASGTCTAALVEADAVLHCRSETLAHGQAARLAVLAQDVLQDVLAGACPVRLIAVTVGPGSFTGLRAALALAHGLAAGWGCLLVGVSVPEALAHGSAGEVWATLHSRPGRVFLIRGAAGTVESCAIEDVPSLPPGVALAGNAAGLVAERPGVSPIITATVATPRAIAAVALQRAAGRLPYLAAQPLYVDAPEARAAG